MEQTTHLNRPTLSKHFGLIMADLVVIHGMKLDDETVLYCWESWLRSLPGIDIDWRDKMVDAGPRMIHVLDAMRAVT